MIMELIQIEIPVLYTSTGIPTGKNASAWIWWLLAAALLVWWLVWLKNKDSPPVKPPAKIEPTPDPDPGWLS